MLGLLLLLGAMTFGSAATYFLPTRIILEQRIAFGSVFGLALMSVTLFLLSLLVGFSMLTVFFMALILLCGSAVLFARFGKELGRDWRDLKKRSKALPWRTVAVVFLLFMTLLVAIFSRSIYQQDGVIYAGFSNVWGDWNQHLMQTNAFAYGDNLPPELTSMSGQRLTYPFTTNFVSAALIKGGLPLLPAMRLPVMLLAVLGLACLMSLARIAFGWRAAVIVPFLFYLSGGLGFINFLDDLFHIKTSLPDFFANLPHSYTITWGDVPLPNINFINVVYAYLVPQRAFVFGLPIVLTTLSLLWLGIKERQRWTLLAAGCMASLLPLIHTHGLVFLGFMTPPLMLLTARHFAKGRKITWHSQLPWLYFLAPIFVVGLPLFLWLTAGVNTAKFIRPQFGWTKHEDSLIWFWAKNLGFFLPLWLIATYWLKRSKDLYGNFMLSAGVVFLIANLVVFQPWDWDNTKLFAYWYVVSAIGVAALLGWLATRSRRWLSFVVGVVVLTCFAGALDVSRTVQGSYKVELFSQQAQQLGASVRDETPRDSIFLTAQYANNPYAALGGRRIVLGYTGWLWSYGITYSERETDVVKMFEGAPEAPELLQKYGVSFVVISNAERNDAGYTVNEPFFRANYPIWKTLGDTTIYQITNH